MGHAGCPWRLLVPNSGFESRDGGRWTRYARSKCSWPVTAGALMR
jgi:hypothetical protein